MIKWSSKLYMDERIEAEPDKWKQRLEESKFSYSLFCIALASNENNLFDIMNCNELWFRHYRKNDIYVVGLASDKESAFKLVEQIVTDLYSETGEFKVREYFEFVTV